MTLAPRMAEARMVADLRAVIRCYNGGEPAPDSHQGQVSWDASGTQEHAVRRSILPYSPGCETP
jgi:hypothetical protein